MSSQGGAVLGARKVELRDVMERVPVLSDMRDLRKVPAVTPHGAIEQQGTHNVPVRYLHRRLIEVSDEH